MTLDKKLRYMANWTQKEALACWTRYHTLYEAKHQGGLFNAINGGNVNEYIERECKVFVRYARQWAYHHRLVIDEPFVDYTKPPSPDNPHKFP